MPIFVLIRKPSTAFVGQQFDSLCFMACSQSMLHCFIIHASRGYHNGILFSTLHVACFATRIPQCHTILAQHAVCTEDTTMATYRTHYTASHFTTMAQCRMQHSVTQCSFEGLLMFTLHSCIHIAHCMP